MSLGRLGLGKMLGRNSVNALVCYKIVCIVTFLRDVFCVDDSSLEAIMPNDHAVHDMWTDNKFRRSLRRTAPLMSPRVYQIHCQRVRTRGFPASVFFLGYHGIADFFF